MLAVKSDLIRMEYGSVSLQSWTLLVSPYLLGSKMLGRMMKLIYNELFVEEGFAEKQHVTNSVPDSKYVAVSICLEVLKPEIQKCPTFKILPRAYVHQSFLSSASTSVPRTKEVEQVIEDQLLAPIESLSAQ